MTVTARYSQNKADLIVDSAQQAILVELQTLHDHLVRELAKRARFPFLRQPKLQTGIYLWGGVGIGKTYLMDCFYQALPFKNKMRWHFFDFMQWVHAALKKHHGKSNPLNRIAKELARDHIVICLDEFIVTDIVDAMLLANLLKAFFQEGISFVTTSNVAPDKLYERGLQREQFLPAIDAIKSQMQVLHLATKQDYRLRFGIEQRSHATDYRLQTLFNHLVEAQPILSENITIHDRNVAIIARTQEIIWLDFHDICCIPRSNADYLWLSKNYHKILLSNIPNIRPEQKNTIRLFISLIDVFYDANCEFYFSTLNAIENIYTHGDMIFEFQRTKSRLIEMQNKYLYKLNINQKA